MTYESYPDAYDGDLYRSFRRQLPERIRRGVEEEFHHLRDLCMGQ